MTWVATAVVGGAVVGAYASNKAAGKAADATRAGADSAARAQMYSTDRQIEEIQRQFNYQTRTLQPRLEAQGAGTDAFRALTGTLPELADVRDQLQQNQRQERNLFQQFQASGDRQAELRQEIQALESAQQQRINLPGGGRISRGYQIGDETLTQQERDARLESLRGELDNETARFDNYNQSLAALGEDSARYRREIEQIERASPFLEGGEYRQGPNGSFFDPNLDPTRLQDTETLSGQVRDTLQAGTSAADDPFRNYIADNQIASATPEGNALVNRADQVRMAGPTLEGDVLRSDVAGRMLADGAASRELAGSVADRSLAAGAAGRELAGNVAGRRIADGAAGTGVYGDEFQTSPGYNFAVEEMNRSLDRRNSAGGNYGGRAIMEAQRRAQGLANQEYYNWAAGRERDLGRLGAAEAADIQRLDYAEQADRQSLAGAEAMDASRLDSAELSDRAALMQAEALDASRLDTAAQNYVSRQVEDVRRGDVALNEWERQRIMDQGRGDAAYENYLMRRQGDATRMDTAASAVDRYQALDRQRVDQSYYNFLNAQAGVAGFSNAAGEAVSSSQAAGGQIANAYGNQGNMLANIYNTAGQNQANITASNYANINNAIQSGIGNFVTYKALTA